MKLKTLKKLLSAFLATLMVILGIPMTATKVNAATSGDYTYTVSNSKATITGADESISGDIVIPDTLGGRPVTTIGNGAFNDCDGLTSIIIPNSVTTIGNSAFYDCDNLASTTIPNSVTTIEEYAFYSCSKLVSITIPDSVTTIGGKAFSMCSDLTSVTIGNGVTTIGESAFFICIDLTSVTIGNGVTTIEESAFYGCLDLTSVTIGNSVTTIGEKAFYSCSNLTSINIPSSVKTVEKSAFQDCKKLTSVYYGDSIDNWNNITTYVNNSELLSATIHYNVTDPDNHYVYTVIDIPTCTKPGTASYVCPCGYSKGTESVPADDHDPVYHEGKSPTCTEVGWDAYETCSRCDYTTYTEIPTNNHIGGTATCNSKAVCAVCHNQYGKTDPSNHDIIQHKGNAPTCTEKGFDSYETCSRCDYTTYKDIPANGHSTVEHSAKSPTCTESGWFAYETCENCDYTTYIELRAYGHQYENGICIHCSEGKSDVFIYGDVNGDGNINLSDVSTILKYIAKWEIEMNNDAADVNCDDKINLTDVSTILKYITKWDVVLGK